MNELRHTKAQCDELTVAIAKPVNEGSVRFTEIQLTFSRIVKEVLHRTAVLYVQQKCRGDNARSKPAEFQRFTLIPNCRTFRASYYCCAPHNRIARQIRQSF